MKVAFAHLCDYASISREGKLSVMGIFENIFSQQFPMVHPMMFLAFALEMRSSEFGQPFEMKVKLVTADGAQIAELSLQANIKPGVVLAPQASGATHHVPQLLALNGVPFQKAGRYSFDIFVNGDHKQSVEFALTQVPPQGLPWGGTPAPQPGSQP